MAKPLQSRRDALREIVGTMAAAAALSSTQIEELLAQVKNMPDLRKVSGIRPTSDAAKALKVLLTPRSQAAQVFESEFGRRPMLTPSKDPKAGGLTCQAYLGMAASCNKLGCALVVCNVLASPGGEVPTEQAQQYGQGPGNTASTGGGCIYTFKPSWGCTEACTAKCNIVVPPTAGAAVPKINPAWLQSVKDDPYVLGVMREFGVKTVADLETELAQAMTRQRAGK